MSNKKLDLFGQKTTEKECPALIISGKKFIHLCLKKFVKWAHIQGLFSLAFFLYI